ncbi:MAG: hypothetical protein JWP88_415 [Flaviaesturariibacter sp.]|nr:hypothetical protein [Flaviaesturariibacter sp.]
MSTDIQHRLSQFEATPPLKVWDAIAAELDTDSSTFAQKLAAYETAPPTAVWGRVAAELDTVATSAQVVPFYQKHSKLIRYGSMAAAIFAAVIVFNLFSKNAESDSVSNVSASQQMPNPDTKPAPITEIPNSVTAIVPETSRTAQSAVIQRDAIAAAKVSPNRYMTMANNDGKTVRLSKKVYPVIDCAEKTEESTWSKCKENIQSMQAKMSASVGAGDFGGLIDMIKSLEEKQ